MIIDVFSSYRIFSCGFPSREFDGETDELIITKQSPVGPAWKIRPFQDQFRH